MKINETKIFGGLIGYSFIGLIVTISFSESNKLNVINLIVVLILSIIGAIINYRREVLENDKQSTSKNKNNKG